MYLKSNPFFFYLYFLSVDDFDGACKSGLCVECRLHGDADTRDSKTSKTIFFDSEHTLIVILFLLLLSCFLFSDFFICAQFDAFFCHSTCSNGILQLPKTHKI